MAKYIKVFQTHTEYQSFMSTQDFLLPNVSHCIDNDDVHYNPIHDFSNDYLTFTALEDNETFTFKIDSSIGGTYVSDVSYSLDNGTTWTTTNVTSGDTDLYITTPSVNAGSKVLWKGNAEVYGKSGDNCVFSSNDKNFNVEGNIMSMLYGDDFMGKNDLTDKNTCFAWFFSRCELLVNAKNLILPATTLAIGCYSGMFSNCTSLTSAPNLPATTLAIGCYSGMFSNCTSLTSAPNLPATTLANNCYGGMFGESGLTQEANIPDELVPLSSTYCSTMYCSCPIATQNGKYDSRAYECPGPL